MAGPPVAPQHAAVGAPSAWVVRFAALAPPGEVLDLACGSGRHARLFAGIGHAVLAADRDPLSLLQLRAVAIDAGMAQATIATMQVDFETPAMPDDAASHAGSDQHSADDCYWPFAGARFSAIVVTNYLHRPLLPHLVDSLVPGGVLIYETFAAGNALFGKPSNPAFLLQPGELLDFALQSTPPLRIVAFEDGYVVHPAPAMVQRLCAIKPGGPVGASSDTDSFPHHQVRL